jgi:hypothetical protein
MQCGWQGKDKAEVRGLQDIKYACRTDAIGLPAEVAQKDHITLVPITLVD